MEKILTEKSSRNLITVGILIIVLGFALFLWQNIQLNTSIKADTSKIAEFGDFIGGFVGSIWALAGVILFYVALKEQRKDFSTNSKVLTAQVKALDQQIKEFELQREELKQTREVFQIQSETLKIQQFESTFFNLLNLHNKIVDSMDLVSATFDGKTVTNGRDCFNRFVRGYYNNYNTLKNNSSGDDLDIIKKSYLKYYNKHQSDLGHYFRNLYNILKFINKSKVDNKKDYSNFLRAQLSSQELILLFYNCLSDKGNEKFKPLIEKFQFLKNLPKDSLVDKQHMNYYYNTAFEK